MPWENGKSFGRFRGLLLDETELKKESNKISDQIYNLRNRQMKEELSDPELAIEFCNIYIISRSNSKVNILEPGIKFLPEHIPAELKSWLKAPKRIQLTKSPPTALEMAMAQSRGIRLATISWEDSINGTLVEGKRDAFEHLLHDISHAYTFYRSDYKSEEQIKFFQKIIENYHHYEELFHNDKIFLKKFEYCISDMNTHPAHLKAYLNAIIIEHFLREEGKSDQDSLSTQGKLLLQKYYIPLLE
jgi:hypothetical protein